MARRRVNVDRTLVAGTDNATVFLYHPEDLRHRATSPPDWPFHGFACGAEFEAGRLAAFGTGGDGRYQVRVTDGDLTAREEAAAGASWDFRYAARRGRVLVDGGDGLPNDEYFEAEPDEGRWVRVPDGRYRVTVRAILREGDGGAVGERLPDYVVLLRPVAGLGEVAVPARTPPLVVGGAARARPEAPEDDAFEEDPFGPPEGAHLALVVDRVPVPGESLAVERPAKVARALEKALAGPAGRAVLLDALRARAVGALARCDGAFRRGGHAAGLSFVALRLVRVTGLSGGEDAPAATVAPFARPAGAPGRAELDRVKRAFARYAAEDGAYRDVQVSPEFEAERLAAMTSPSAISNFLLVRLGPMLPDASRRGLLVASDAFRVRAVLEFLGARNDGEGP